MKKINIDDLDYCKTCKLISKYNELLEENERLHHYKTLYQSLKRRNDRAIDIIKNHNTELVLINNEEGRITIDFQRLYDILVSDKNE